LAPPRGSRKPRFMPEGGAVAPLPLGATAVAASGGVAARSSSGRASISSSRSSISSSASPSLPASPLPPVPSLASAGASCAAPERPGGSACSASSHGSLISRTSSPCARLRRRGQLWGRRGAVVGGGALGGAQGTRLVVHGERTGLYRVLDRLQRGQELLARGRRRRGGGGGRRGHLLRADGLWAHRSAVLGSLYAPPGANFRNE
jgi:hypothetical protein